MSASRPPGEGSRAVAEPDLRRALAYVVPYAPRLALVLVLSLVGTGLALCLPYLAKLLVDDALVGRDTGALVRIVAIFVALTLANFAANVASGIRYTRVSADILFDMRLALYRHLQRLSPRFYARTPLGDIVSRINNDIGEIQRVAAETALAWLGHVLFLVGAVVVMLWLDARLFLVAVAVLPASVWALVHYRRRLEGSVAELRARSAEIGTFLIETLQGMRTVVAANAQHREVERFRARNGRFVASVVRMQWLRYLAGGLPGLLLAGGTAAVFLYGGARVIGGDLTLGTFVAFMAYQMRLLSPIEGLMGLYANLATVRVSLRRVHALLDTAPEVVEAADARPLAVARGELRLEDVSFGFGRGAPVLQRVSMHVRPGETLAIVGASGSGKSTLADLLVRQLDPDGGRILLDGHDLRALRLADLRRLVAVLDQEAFLFHATLAENVRYARPDAGDEEVDAALRAAGLGALLEALPDGLATVAGERGRTFSAGERQRIALARAFLADPSVLVLDEPTSALDAAAEAHVVRGYEAVMRGRTTIVISHRADLVCRADRVVVLEGGRVVQEGAPAELFGRPGPLARLLRGDEGAPVVGAAAPNGPPGPGAVAPWPAGG